MPFKDVKSITVCVVLLTALTCAPAGAAGAASASGVKVVGANVTLRATSETLVQQALTVGWGGRFLTQPAAVIAPYTTTDFVVGGTSKPDGPSAAAFATYQEQAHPDRVFVLMTTINLDGVPTVSCVVRSGGGGCCARGWAAGTWSAI